VLPDVAQTQRARIADEDAQDAVAPRQVADRAVGRRVDPAREKALELKAALVEDAQRGVARAGQLAGDVEHAVENDLEVQLGHQRAPDFE
jgi:hypothetical protein